MKRCIYFTLVLVAYLPLFSPSQAATNGGARTMPIGVASYSELDQEYFLLGFFHSEAAVTTERALMPDGNRKLEFKISSDKVTHSKFSRVIVNSVAVNTDRELSNASTQSLNRFLKSLNVSLHRNDVLVIAEKNDSSGVHIRLNDKLLVEINDPDFFNLMLISWIGDIPPSRQFKAALLGEAKPEDIDRFINISPNT